MLSPSQPKLTCVEKAGEAEVLISSLGSAFLRENTIAF
jgi:hypothetical protein